MIIDVAACIEYGSVPKSTVDQWLSGIPHYDPCKNADGYTFYAERALLFVDFFTECLTHKQGKGQGKPFALEPWQSAIVANLFGWLNADGNRRYRESLIFVPRGAGKTTLCAGLAVCTLIVEQELGAEVLCVASSAEQADYLFSSAAYSILHDDALSGQCDVFNTRIRHRGRNSVLRRCTASSKTLHGSTPHAAFIDELHVITPAIFEAVSSGMSKRDNSLLVCLTTAGIGASDSACLEYYKYATGVRDGLIPDNRFLPVIYEMDKDADWRVEANWYQAQPNLGVSVSIEDYRRDFHKALTSSTYEMTFKQLKLNQWIAKSAQAIRPELWSACKSDFTLDDVKHLPCWVGVDLAYRQDMAAVVQVFFDMPTKSYYVVPHIFLPRETAMQDDKKHYLEWAIKKHLTLTDGATTDFETIRNKIKDIGSTCDMRQVGLDPWNARQLMSQLEADGYKVVEVRQGFYSLSDPTKELLAMIADKRVQHTGHPVLNFCMLNLALRTDANGNLAPDREKSAGKIDGAVATINALHCLLRNSVATPKKSYYFIPRKDNK